MMSLLIINKRYRKRIYIYNIIFIKKKRIISTDKNNRLNYCLIIPRKLRKKKKNINYFIIIFHIIHYNI